MQQRKAVVSLVFSSWNLCALLLYAEAVKADKLKIILAKNIEAKYYVRPRVDGIEIEFITIKDTVFQFLNVIRVALWVRKIPDLEYVKFTNFSFFGQFLQWVGIYKRVTFLDDGSTFINLLDKSLKYDSSFRSLLKRIFWPPGFSPDFDCFKGVDTAYLNLKHLVDTQASTLNVHVEDFNTIFSYEKLRTISEKYFDISDEIQLWKNNFKDCHVLVLGSSFVEHGFLSEMEYRNILSRALIGVESGAIYKPHPSEVQIQDYDFSGEVQIERFSNLPIELFLAESAPARVISFGSTSAFILMDAAACIQVDLLLLDKIFSKKVVEKVNLLANDHYKIQEI